MKVKMRRGAWHTRLQAWTFAHDPTLRSNLCPYFWLTVFCVAVVPFVAPWRVLKACTKALGRGIERVGDCIYDANESRKKAALTWAATKLSSVEAYCIQRLLDDFKANGYNNYPHHVLWRLPLTSTRFRELLDALARIDPQWRDRLDVDQSQLDAAFDAWLSQLEEDVTRHERRMDAFALWTQRVVKAIKFAFIGALIAVFAGLLGILIYKVITEFWEIEWLVVGIIVGFIAFAVSLTIALCYVASKAIDYAHTRSRFRQLRDVPTREPEPGLLSLYMQAAKERYCPGIQWLD